MTDDKDTSIYRRLPPQDPYPTAAAEAALTAWGIDYKEQPDGTLLVDGDLDISNKGLTELPDLRCVAVTGIFSCRRNALTSLLLAPQRVDTHYDCSFNKLTSLEGAPREIGGEFHGNDNALITLRGAPRVTTKFYCQNNEDVKSLQYAPRKFSRLTSDFGSYMCWEFVPEELRFDKKRHLNEGLPLTEDMEPAAKKVIFKKKEPPLPKIKFKQKPQNPQP